MIAISNEVQERTLEFNSKSLLGNTPVWTTVQGTIVYHGTTVELDADSIAAITKSNINKKLTYLKINCELDANDHTLSTQFSKKVAIVVKVTYSGNKPNNTFVFYPNYIFEDDPETFTVVELSGDKVSSIDVQIINSENTHVDAYNMNLYYIVEIDSNNINEEIKENYEDNPVNNPISDVISDNIQNNNDVQTELNNVIQNYITQQHVGSVIPFVSSLPSINSVPDGYICRLR